MKEFIVGFLLFLSFASSFMLVTFLFGSIWTWLFEKENISDPDIIITNGFIVWAVVVISTVIYKMFSLIGGIFLIGYVY